MIKVIKKDDTQEEFILGEGDIIVTNSSDFLVLCDGCGNFYFQDLDDVSNFLMSNEDVNGAHRETVHKKYKIGDSFGKYSSKIKKVIRSENVEHTIKY